MTSFSYRIDGVLPASESHWSCHVADELWLILAFLRRGSLIVKRPFDCIAGLLKLHSWREFCRFLFGTYHRRDQLASLLTENFAKPPQVLDVIICHVQPLVAEPSTRALQDLNKKSGRASRPATLLRLLCRSEHLGRRREGEVNSGPCECQI